MSAEFDAFREWEQKGPFLHVLIIERGDGEPEDRLTFTDRAYVDKGAGGVKYHDTYPAPVHCIISPMRISLGVDRCSYDEIVIANAAGRFDGLYDEALIVGKPFRVLRGSPAWSLSETRLPFMFLPIFTGIVESVNFRKRGDEVVFRLSPARYRMDTTIGSASEPVCLGSRFNVPATLVNASSLRYRFCANVARDGEFFELRDRGVVLNEPDDYSKVLEGGTFKTLIELVSPPAGQLSASMVGGAPILIQNVVAELSWLTTEYLHPDYSLELARKTVLYGESGACSNPGRTKLYLKTFSNDRIYQYSMSADEPSTLTYDGIFSSAFTGSAFQLNQAGTKLWYIDGTSRLRTRTLSTPFDIGTSIDDAALKVMDATYVDIFVAPDESCVWVCRDHAIKKFLVTPGNASTAVEDPSGQIDLSPFIVGFVRRFTFIDDGHGLIVYDSQAGQLRQFRLFSPYGTEVIDLGRAYSAQQFSWNATINVRSLIGASDSQSLLVVDSAPSVNKIALAGDLRPNTILRNCYIDFLWSTSTSLFVNQETRAGAVLANLIAGIFDGYHVDRLGGLRYIKLLEPDFNSQALTDEPLFELGFNDFIGVHDYIQIVDTMEEVDKVTMNYKRNDLVQTPGDLATSLPVASVENYGKEWSTHAVEATVKAGLEDLVFDTSINGGANNAAQSVLRMRGRPRKVYQLNTNLRWLGISAPFDVGAVIKVKDDWQFPSLDVGDVLIVTSIEIDYTRGTMQIRAYR